MSTQPSQKTGKKKIRCINSGIIYDDIKDAAAQLGLNQSDIRRVLYKRKNDTRGFKFELFNSK